MRTKYKSIRSFLFGLITGAGSTALVLYTTRPEMHSLPLEPDSIKVMFTYPKGFREVGFIECEKTIVHLINKATTNIFIQAYAWTSSPIAKAISDAKARGVEVKAILDKENEHKHSSAMKLLLDNQIDVRIRHISGISHNKIIIIDEKIVITGSYNFSKAANEKNDENIVIIHNTTVADRYVKNWYKCYEYSAPVGESLIKETKPWRKDYGEDVKYELKDLVTYIDSATSSVYVNFIKTFDQPTLKALVRAKQRGCDVRILVNRKDSVQRLSEYGIEVKLLNSSAKHSHIFIDKSSEILVVYEDNQLKPKSYFKSGTKASKFVKDWNNGTSRRKSNRVYPSVIYSSTSAGT